MFWGRFWTDSWAPEQRHGRCLGAKFDGLMQKKEAISGGGLLESCHPAMISAPVAFLRYSSSLLQCHCFHCQVSNQGLAVVLAGN